MNKQTEAMKQSLITEAAIQSKDHPSKDARTFAKSVHEYLMAEQPAQQALDKMAENARELGIQMQPEEPRAWFTVDELNAWADKKLKENPQWAEQPAQPQEPVPTECRRDGRCQYAIDNGIEGLSLGFPQPAQPQQEPVAWCTKNDLENMAKGFTQDAPARAMRVRQLYPKESIVLLYTSPPARKPLTDEQIYSVLENLQVMYNRPPTTDSRIIFARAIEAAHGIKGDA